MSTLKRSIWIGFDAREAAAYAVARSSVYRHLTGNCSVRGLILDELKMMGLFYRPQHLRTGATSDTLQLWDDISEAPCATEFSISRFLVPVLAKTGLAVFMDCDVLARADMQELFGLANRRYAVMCVKHKPYGSPKAIKMDGQMQTVYERKNWSSVMLFNCDHPSNKALTVELVNTVSGRDLHRFCWLRDEEIGELGPEWNWLAGYHSRDIEPKIVHHTDGSPCLPGYEGAAYTEEWHEELREWAR